VDESGHRDDGNGWEGFVVLYFCFKLYLRFDRNINHRIERQVSVLVA